MIINKFIILISLTGICISSMAFSADTGSESSNIPMSGKELAQKVYDRENGDDSILLCKICNNYMGNYMGNYVIKFTIEEQE